MHVRTATGAGLGTHWKASFGPGVQLCTPLYSWCSGVGTPGTRTGGAGTNTSTRSFPGAPPNGQNARTPRPCSARVSASASTVGARRSVMQLSSGPWAGGGGSGGTVTRRALHPNKLTALGSAEERLAGKLLES